MVILPTILLALSGISGFSGLALSAKSAIDSYNAEVTNHMVQEQNNRNILRLEACSKQLDEALEELGKQRMVVTKNFSAFVNAFEKIHGRPQFTSGENVALPEVSFDEIQNVSVIAGQLLGTTVGAIGGSMMAAAASSGTTAAVMALGTASTGTKIATLNGAASIKATLAALGGGALSASGGGIALGTLVLNCASLGAGVLVEGLAMAFAGSLSKKKADETKEAMIKNEAVITNAINMQLDITRAAKAMIRASVDICNNVYKPLVMRMKQLVALKEDWNTYTDEEKALVENNILVVQILHYLNNTSLYKVTKSNDAGEVEEVESNSPEVDNAIKHASESIKELKK